MPKGYWIARMDVDDEAAYTRYRDANAPAFIKYGARFLVRGGPYEVMEGGARSRNVVVEFDSVETAVACYRSEEYQSAAAHRKDAAVGDLIVVEGYDGPQPA